MSMETALATHVVAKAASNKQSNAQAVITFQGMWLLYSRSKRQYKKFVSGVLLIDCLQ